MVVSVRAICLTTGEAATYIDRRDFNIENPCEIAVFYEFTRLA